MLEVVILHLTTASPQAGPFRGLLCFRHLLPAAAAAGRSHLRHLRSPPAGHTGIRRAARRRALDAGLRAHDHGSAVFGIGAILCFYVVLPVSPERLAQIREWIPSASSVRQHGDRRRRGHAVHAAYSIGSAPPSGWPSPCCASGLSAPAAFLSWFVALMSLIVLLSVLSIRRKCCRPSSLWKLHLTPSWLFAIVSVLVCSAGLGLLITMDPSDPSSGPPPTTPPTPHACSARSLPKRSF